jgi:hypothetical protein
MKQDKKFKTLQIDSIIHDVVVRYCKENGLKISFFVEKSLINTMRNLNEPTKTRTE